MIAWLKQVFAGPHGKTALVATHATAGVVTFLGLSIWHVIGQHRPFDGQAFADSWMIVLGVSAAAIGGHAILQSKAAQNAGSGQ